MNDTKAAMVENRGRKMEMRHVKKEMDFDRSERSWFFFISLVIDSDIHFDSLVLFSAFSRERNIYFWK